LVIALASAGCRPEAELPDRADEAVPDLNDPSFVVGRVDGKPDFRDGKRYSKAVLNVEASQTVVIPDNATLDRGGPDGRVEIFMVKYAQNRGFPAPTDCERVLKMVAGDCCVRRVEEGKLVLGTTGGWDGDEQGVGVRMRVRAPERQSVERRAGLSGNLWRKPDPRQTGKDGWEAVPLEPDPQRTAY
jgi:hypothetical protein